MTDDEKKVLRMIEERTDHLSHLVGELADKVFDDEARERLKDALDEVRHDLRVVHLLDQ